MKYAHLVNSGSSANLIAFMVLTAPELGERRILPGDEVITVACGFPTTVTPVLNYGAVPVFVDVTVPQYNIDVTKLEGALSPKTKAVMIAHTLGNPFDLKAVKAFCDQHKLWLVEAGNILLALCLLLTVLPCSAGADPVTLYTASSFAGDDESASVYTELLHTFESAEDCIVIDRSSANPTEC